MTLPNFTQKLANEVMTGADDVYQLCTFYSYLEGPALNFYYSNIYAGIQAFRP